MLDKPSEEIKQRLDLIEVIQEYTQIKKVGNNWKGLCPFHNEKTPSFMASEEKQIWKCFGCDAGGDVFKFIMMIEGIEFVEALRLLADKAGVELKKQDPKLQTKRNKILEILDLSSKFYNKALIESKSGKIARDYLLGRKLEEITWDEFLIGYSPESWDMLTKFLKKKGFQDEEIIESGMVVKKENGLGYYDRFRNRLMFPINDIHGNTVGFGGRVLDKTNDKQQAKYINSPQTFVYDKSRVLYGLDKAKSEIRKNNYSIVVEGYTDVITSHQAGIKNVVAASGTALTLEQIELLKRYSENVILAFDMDSAGDMATKRGINLAQSKGLNVKILELPSGKDPDECIKEDIEMWKKSIREAKSIMEYYFESTLKQVDLNRVEDKKKAAALLLPQIKIIPNKIEQTHYLQKLGELLGVDEKILTDSMNSQKKEERMPKESPGAVKKRKMEKSEDESLGMRFLSIMLSKPELLINIKSDIEPEYLPEKYIPLYTELISYYNDNEAIDSDEFIKKIEEKNNELAFLAKEVLLYFDKEFTENEMSDAAELKDEVEIITNRLKKSYLKRRLGEIKSEMSKAEEAGDAEKINKLLKEFNGVSKIISNI